MRVKIAALALLGAIGLAGCSGTGGGATISHQETETGSSLVYPLLAGLDQGWSTYSPHILFVPTSSSSGTGLKDVAAGLVSIGMSDVPLPTGTRGLINIPVTVAGLEVGYNLGPRFRDVHLRLNGQVVAAMWSGRITTWNARPIAALNPGVKLPDTPVVPFIRLDPSGSTALFTSWLQEQSPVGWPAPGKTVTWPGSPVGETGSDGVVQGCEKQPGCIAYYGVSYGSGAHDHGLGTAALANGSGRYVLPTQATIALALAQFAPATPASGTLSMIGAKGDAYPVINYEYALVNPRQPDAGQATALRQLLLWIITAGAAPKYLKAVGFDALPASTLVIAERLIGQIRGAKA